MLEKWEPEDEQFWEQTGKKVANRTLWITTGALFLSFATWFMWSAIIVKLPDVGFAGTLTGSKKFWLASMPGLAGATLRIPYSFIIQKFGTRKVVTLATASLLIPSLGAGWVVQHPETPYWVLLLLAFLAGFGGGNFAAFMSSTSYFFPKKKQGMALGVQAGIGNFGVSATQFLVPAVIGGSIFGAIAGGAQHVVDKGGVETGKLLWLQNAGFIYVIPVLIFTIAAAIWLRDVPVVGSFKSQFVIFRRKHNWIMTSLYFMTFGSFAGLSASFPLMIKELFGDIPNPPDALAYAFLGPLIGSATRPIAGWVSDKTGGAIITHLCAIVLLIGSVAVTFFTTGDNFTAFLIIMLILFFAAGVGNGSTFRQIPIIFEKKEAGPVLGWTSAIAAYGSFLFPVLIGLAISSFGGSPNAFFYFMAVFYAFNLFLNWWYYTRKNAEVHC